MESVGHLECLEAEPVHPKRLTPHAAPAQRTRFDPVVLKRAANPLSVFNIVRQGGKGYAANFPFWVWSRVCLFGIS